MYFSGSIFSSRKSFMHWTEWFLWSVQLLLVTRAVLRLSRYIKCICETWKNFLPSEKTYSGIMSFILFALYKAQYYYLFSTLYLSHFCSGFCSCKCLTKYTTLAQCTDRVLHFGTHNTTLIKNLITALSYMGTIKIINYWNQKSVCLNYLYRHSIHTYYTIHTSSRNLISKGEALLFNFRYWSCEFVWISC